MIEGAISGVLCFLLFGLVFVTGSRKSKDPSEDYSGRSLR